MSIMKLFATLGLVTVTITAPIYGAAAAIAKPADFKDKADAMLKGA